METTWTLEPAALALAALALGLYAQAFVRLRRRSGATHADGLRAPSCSRRASPSRCSGSCRRPTPSGEDQLLAAHMLQHCCWAISARF